MVFDLALDVEASLPRCLRFEASESHQTDAESQQAGAEKVRQPKTWLQRIRTQLWKLLSRAYVSVETRPGTMLGYYLRPKATFRVLFT